MKAKLVCSLNIALGFLALGTTTNRAQSPDALPTLKVNAIDNSALEVPATDTGRVRINRIGADNSADLVVFYSVSGTATNGTDYKVLRGTVTIPAGRGSASIAVRPIDDTIAEPDETVTLTLSPDPSYIVGSPRSAMVTIHSNE